MHTFILIHTSKHVVHTLQVNIYFLMTCMRTCIVRTCARMYCSVIHAKCDRVSLHVMCIHVLFHSVRYPNSRDKLLLFKSQWKNVLSRVDSRRKNRRTTSYGRDVETMLTEISHCCAVTLLTGLGLRRPSAVHMISIYIYIYILRMFGRIVRDVPSAPLKSPCARARTRIAPPVVRTPNSYV